MFVNRVIQKLINFGQQSLFKVEETQQPLLNNDEILELLLCVKNNNKTRPHKLDISFRKTGDVRSIFRGQGMDYEESRKFQPGDDPRYMNWQLSARTGQHYMKVFREERQPGIFILIDRRYSMRFGTKQRLKITQAVRAAAIAAFTAQEKKFSIGGVILDKELQWFNENQNKQAVFDFIHQAARPASPVFEYKMNQNIVISDVLRLLNEVLTTGSKVYLISDFQDLKKESQPALLQLSSKHEVYALQIIDPAEIKLPQAGELSLRDTNSYTQYDINTSSQTEQSYYNTAATQLFEQQRQLFENIAISYKQILTSDNKIQLESFF